MSAQSADWYGELRVCGACERAWLPRAGDKHTICSTCRVAMAPEPDRLLARLIQVYGPRAP